MEKDYSKQLEAFNGLSQDSISNKTSLAFSDNMDGGIEGLLGTAKSSTLRKLEKLSKKKKLEFGDDNLLTKYDHEVADKIMNVYLENIVKTLDPEGFEEMEDTLKNTESERTKQRYLADRLILNYNLSDQQINGYLNAAVSSIADQGNVGLAINQFSSALTDQRNGVVSSLARKGLDYGITDVKLGLDYANALNQELSKYGKQIDPNTIAANKDKIIQLGTSVINESIDKGTQRAYGMQEYKKAA